jgi:DNA helicase TIP49 (TBP-interacting protein)
MRHDLLLFKYVLVVSSVDARETALAYSLVVQLGSTGSIFVIAACEIYA